MSCRMSVKKFKGILCNSSGEIYSWKNASSDFTTGLLRNHSIWDIPKENPNVVAVQIPSGTSKKKHQKEFILKFQKRIQIPFRTSSRNLNCWINPLNICEETIRQSLRVTRRKIPGTFLANWMSTNSCKKSCGNYESIFFYEFLNKVQEYFMEI